MAVDPPPLPRRRPICKNCGRPMLGHKRDSQKNYVCFSPPSSPTTDRSILSSTDSFYTTSSQAAGTSVDEGEDDIASISSSRLPPVGSWDKERRLSSWHASSTSPDTPEGRWDDESLVPTVLIDSDQMTLRSGPRLEVTPSFHTPQSSLQIMEQSLVRNRGRPQTPSTISLDHENLRSMTPLTDLGGINNTPLVYLTAVDPADVSRVLDLSKRQGFHTAVLLSSSSPMNRLPITSPQSRASGNDDADSDKVTIVIGVDPVVVRQYAEMTHRTVPGTIASDREMMAAPRLITTCQLFCTVVLAIILIIPVFLLCI